MRICTLALLCVALAAGEADVEAAPAASAKGFLGIAFDQAASTFDGGTPVVLRVEPGSPAAVMGLAAGDRIAAIDGSALADTDALARALSTRPPGTRIALTVRRPRGEDAAEEKLEFAGVLQEPPRARAASLGAQVAELQERIAALQERQREPTLPEMLVRLQEIERDLPKAAAAFKKVYPDGEFRIVISAEISTNRTAAEPLAIDVGGKPSPTSAVPPTPGNPTHGTP